MEILRGLLALGIYILIIAILFLVKPDAMFNREDGSIKSVGFSDEGKSLLSLYIVAPLIALFIYIITISIL